MSDVADVCGNCGWALYWQADYDGTLWAACGSCGTYVDDSTGVGHV